MSRPRNIVTRPRPSTRLREVTPCLCGAEHKLRGKCVGPRCWAAASPNLRQEVYSKDQEVCRAAWRSLLDFALSRKEAKP